MSLKTDNRGSNWSWDKPVKAFIWRSSRICRPIGGLPPWFFEDSLPHLLLRNNSHVYFVCLLEFLLTFLELRRAEWWIGADQMVAARLQLIADKRFPGIEDFGL